jgi:hypothetical protein
MSVFQSLGGVITSPPEIVAWGQNSESLFAFGVGTDQALWYAQFDGFFRVGEHWDGWQSLGGIVTSAPCAVRSGASSVDVFATGAHSELLHWQFRNGAWTRWPVSVTIGGAIPLAPNIVSPGPHRYWESLGGILTSPPTATLFGDLNDAIVVFAAGTDHTLWTIASFGGTWGNWQQVGGHVLSSSPHAVTFQGDFVVFALGTDSAIWYTKGGNWTSLGGQFSTTPYAVATSEHVSVFAADLEGALQYSAWDGNSWSAWTSLGGLLMSHPTASSFENSELLQVYAIGADSAIWHRRGNGGSWTDWVSLGGTFLSPPAAVARLADNVPARDIVALGTDHALWHFEMLDL